MSYNTIATVAQDAALRHRIMACIAQEDPDPGRDEGVITDGQILAAVQAVLNA